MKTYVTSEEAQYRWPRLVKAMTNVALLSTGEATCALRDWYNREHYWGSREPEWYVRNVQGGEATSHYGGVHKVITNAFRLRGLIRRGVYEDGSGFCLIPAGTPRRGACCPLSNRPTY